MEHSHHAVSISLTGPELSFLWPGWPPGDALLSRSLCLVCSYFEDCFVHREHPAVLRSNQLTFPHGDPSAEVSEEMSWNLVLPGGSSWRAVKCLACLEQQAAVGTF